MAHLIEPASSGRAKCRGCGTRIAKGELRFGERLPNPYAEGEMTHWFHVPCAAYKRPEPFLETVESSAEPIEDRERLVAGAKLGLDHRRLPRASGADHAPTGRARCRSCRELIEKGGWRISLVYYDEGRFDPSGFIHARCAGEYFGTTDLAGRLFHFSPELDEQSRTELSGELDAPQG